MVFNQTLRLKRICSPKSDLDSHGKELKNWFSKRDYPPKRISEQVKRALRSEENVKEKNRQHMKENNVPLVVTYNPNFKNLSFLICKNLKLLYADPETKRVFTPAPFFSFRSFRNLKSFLVNSEVYPLERKVGSAKCNGKRCQVCLNVNETANFEPFQTKQKYKINHHLNYNDKFLIYLLSCKVCGLQYVGSTTDKFRFRWNNYKENDKKAIRGEEHMLPGLFEHFVADNHKCFLTDCSITLIDKTDGLDPTRREEYMKGFKSCGFLWVKYLKLMVTSARFWTFFRGRSLVYVKCILLNHTYVSCKEYHFCILSCSIIFSDGDSNRIDSVN